MGYKNLSTAKDFARMYFHDAKIYKTSGGKYEVFPASSRKPYKSYKLIERITEEKWKWKKTYIGMK